MTSPEDIAAAETRLAEALAEVNRLRAQLAEEREAARTALDQRDEATLRNGLSAAAGREEALRRYGRTNSGLAEAETDRQRAARHRREDAAQEQAREVAQGQADEGRAEAQRRVAARRPS
jgi:hypothetical protein